MPQGRRITACAPCRNLVAHVAFARIQATAILVTLLVICGFAAPNFVLTKP
jgi:hypothetical protein